MPDLLGSATSSLWSWGNLAAGCWTPMTSLRQALPAARSGMQKYVMLLLELADCIRQPATCSGSRSSSGTAARLCFSALTGTCHCLLQTAHSGSSCAETCSCVTRTVLLQYNDMVSWMNVGDDLHNPVAGWFW